MLEWGDFLRGARQANAVPRVHGNGFIQIDISESQRFHFWGHPAIPRQVVSSPIHNHVFDFHSTICKGALTNVEYTPHWREDRSRGFRLGLYGEWQAYPRQGADTGLSPTGRRCDLSVAHVSIMEQGDSYFATGLKFHETIVGVPTVTMITKHGPTLAQNPDGPRPSVLVPGFHEPDNRFDRHGFHPGMLWDIIDEITKGAGK